MIDDNLTQPDDRQNIDTTNRENTVNDRQKDDSKAIIIDGREQRRSKDNLVPCKPGETHNPNGRPKGSKDSLRASLRRYMRLHPTVPVEAALEAMGVDATQIDNAGGLAATLIHSAIVDRDVQAARLIATHCERPLKTDQPEASQITNNHTQVMIYIPDNGRERGRVASSAAGATIGPVEALPAIDVEVAPARIAPPVDPLEELAGFAV